jgi:hypothetical protein
MTPPGRAFAASLAIVLIATAPSVSAGHEPVKRRDPRADAFSDVWTSTKIPIHVAPNRIRFKVYGSFGPDWELSLFLDARGGRRADYRLWNFEDLGTTGCGGKRIHGDAIELRCGRRMVECCFVGALWWTIPRSELGSDKPIRWRVHTHYQGAPDDSQDDHAPDAGWYP